MTDFDIVYVLRHPQFGTETSERNIMLQAADEIERLRGIMLRAANEIERLSAQLPSHVSRRSAKNDGPLPMFRAGRAVKIYSGEYEGHEFWVRRAEYDLDDGKWRYEYTGMSSPVWVPEDNLVPAA